MKIAHAIQLHYIALTFDQQYFRLGTMYFLFEKVSDIWLQKQLKSQFRGNLDGGPPAPLKFKSKMVTYEGLEFSKVHELLVSGHCHFQE